MNKVCGNDTYQLQVASYNYNYSLYTPTKLTCNMQSILHTLYHIILCVILGVFCVV